jgi:hypothetical protein
MNRLAFRFSDVMRTHSRDVYMMYNKSQILLSVPLYFADEKDIRVEDWLLKPNHIEILFVKTGEKEISGKGRNGSSPIHGHHPCHSC